MYELKEKGFEYRGFKLGDKVIYKGEETIVIGFDCKSKWENTIALTRTMGIAVPVIISKSEYISYILNEYENSEFLWAHPSSIKLIPESIADDNLPKEISPIHALDILEDEINKIHHRHGLGDYITEISECIKLLREKENEL